ncbi:hypothetical protein SADUNF_Sadunf16G0277400 [Salix dunnii]|uniref:RRM domain-containing protein n=1 Tax=Salix dunnii TaxID=1413687 RepID=A0A835MMZ2_9ROSI|nr:hypothetical protein SADUNF_Sadunf16G0277400 [Salix dunnii]
MVMRATISALAAAAKAPHGGSLRLFSTTSTISSSFPFPQNTQQTPAREQAEPNTNLFVSGKCLFLYVSYSCSHFLVIITGLCVKFCGNVCALIRRFVDFTKAILFDASIILVLGLSKRTTTEGLQEAFSKFGEVVQAKVVTDRTSGYSKGFGFVRYATLEDAAEGIKGMDGQVNLILLPSFFLKRRLWMYLCNDFQLLSFWMDGLYLQSMQDPNNHLLNPRTWVQDMETTLVLITAGSDPDFRENKFGYSTSMVTMYAGISGIYMSLLKVRYSSVLQSMGAQPGWSWLLCDPSFFRVSAIT